MYYNLNIKNEITSDVIVIGGGTAGVFAAISAARSGCRGDAERECGCCRYYLSRALRYSAFDRCDSPRSIVIKLVKALRRDRPILSGREAKILAHLSFML